MAGKRDLEGMPRCMRSPGSRARTIPGPGEPCFLAAQNRRLLPVLERDVVVTKSFWIYCHEDQRRLRRVQEIWEHLRAGADANRAFLRGETQEMTLV